MYGPDIYFSFIQLRNQLYKLKTQKQNDKYSKIEFYQNEYKTFKRFCDDVNEYFSRRYPENDTQETIQEIFYILLEWSQKGTLKKTLIP